MYVEDCDKPSITMEIVKNSDRNTVVFYIDDDDEESASLIELDSVDCLELVRFIVHEYGFGREQLGV